MNEDPMFREQKYFDKFSNKFNAQDFLPDQIHTMLTLAKKFEAEGKDVFNFTIGAMDKSSRIDALVGEELGHQIGELIMQYGLGYQAIDGIEELRKRYAQSREPSLHIHWSDIKIVEGGGSTAILYALAALVDDAHSIRNRTTVLNCSGWPVYDFMVKFIGGKSIPINLFHDDEFTVSDLEEKIGSDTAAIIFTSPDNPTGLTYSQEQFDMVIKAARKFDVPVILDEVYRDINYIGLPNLRTDYEQCFAVDSFAKVFGAPGCRIGIIRTPSGNGDYSTAARAVHSKLKRVQGSGGTPASATALAILDHHEKHFPTMMKRYSERRKMLLQGENQQLFQDLGWNMVGNLEGAFYAYFTHDKKDPNYCVTLAEQTGMFVVPMPNVIPGKNGFRLCYGSVNLQGLNECLHELKQNYKKIKRIS